MNNLVWVEIEKDKLSNNIKAFRKIAKNNTILAPCVKANAFGHGLVPTAKLFLETGADWLCVNSVEEAEILREAKIYAPILMTSSPDCGRGFPTRDSNQSNILPCAATAF